MKNSWENRVNGRLYGLHLYEAGKVVIWESSGNPHSEIGSAYSYKKFLGGEAQSFIETYFGKETLEEVKSIVQKLIK